MYLQITTRCDMTCEHCAMNSTSRGRDMSENIFRAAVDLASEYGQGIFLGGGEPTLHPQFWSFFGIMLGHALDYEGCGIVTNGNNRQTALGLARLKNVEEIYIALSQDSYHDPIDHDVIAAFKGSFHGGYYYEPYGVGRAKKNGYTRKGCACPEWIVRPSGVIRACCCANAPVIGNVKTGIKEEYAKIYSEHSAYECWNAIKEEIAG